MPSPRRPRDTVVEAGNALLLRLVTRCQGATRSAAEPASTAISAGVFVQLELTLPVFAPVAHPR